EGLDATDAAALRRMDRKRKKKTSNEDWESPSDGEAEIAKLKDGRTALAYKAENAVDMETGAIVAVTTHGGAAADMATVEETVIEAGVAVAELVTVEPPEGKYAVHPGGVEEVVADKGYHSNQVAVGLGELGVRTLHRGTRSGSARLEWQAGRKRSGVWQPAAHSGRAGQADAAAAGGEDRTELRASIRYGWNGPALRPGYRECAQETADPGGGVQSGAADAVDVWSG